MSALELLECTIEHLDYIVEVAKTTFYEAFAEQNAEENIRAYMDSAFHENKLLQELQNPNSIFYLALLNEEIVGYLKLNFEDAQTGLKDNKAVEIERIYVRKEHFGTGIAQALFAKAMAIAQKNRLHYIWLGVWEHNQRAIAFYKKQGFKQFGTHAFTLGQEVQTDILMRLDLL